MDHLRLFQRAVLALLSIMSGGVLIAQDVQRLAVVVGVSVYQKDGLENLQFAHEAADELADELTKQGFKVSKLIGEQATKASMVQISNPAMPLSQQSPAACR